jgi:hypothetical protein
VRTISAIALSFALLSVPPAGRGQSVRGSITGIVSDSSGRPIAGAGLTLVQEEVDRRRQVTASSDGEFAFSLLPPGSYRLEADAPGFRRSLRRLSLLVNQEIRVEVPLLPGSRTDEVSVSAAAPMLKTDSTALGAVIENRQITGLPLDGRNFYELSLLVPGVAPAAPGSAGSVRGDFAISVNGAREDSNNFLLDGIFNSDPKLNATSVAPPVDAIREFEILTNAYDAAFGRNGGAQINVVLRSGANAVHGSAYEFFRNAALDARNFFAPADQPDPRYQRNQFGGSLGAPVIKNRTFLFADYEGRRVREGITRLSRVPTDLERRGDFSRSDPRTPPIDLFTQRPFAGNVIPRERLHPIGAAIAGLYPLPNRADPLQNFVSSPLQRDRDDHFDARLDHSLNRSSEISARYSFVDRSLFEPFSGPTFAAVPGFGTNIPRRAQNVMVSETHVIAPIVINEVRAGFNRVSAGSFHQNMGTSVNRSIGLPEVSANPRDYGLSFITVTGFSPLGDEFNNPQHGVSNTWQFLDHLTCAAGRNVMKFGFDFRSVRQNAYRDVQSRGLLSFVGFTGNALAEMLQGLPSATGVARLDNPQHLRTESYNFFGQHTFRMRPGLTVFTGLRYEFNSPPVDVADRANVFDPATRALVRVGTGGIPRSGYHADRNNWAPRVGLAWNPRGGSTVLRAGYGLYYDQAALAPGEGLYFNAPYFDFRLFVQSAEFPVLLHDPFPANYPFTLPSSALAFDRDLRTAYLQHWNLNVQRQVGATRVLEVGYVGSKGTRLLTARDINQPRPSAAPLNLRPLPFFDDITMLESRGNSVYHSLQARFQQRLSRGVTALAAYTWSKSIDDASSFFSSAGDPNFPQDSFNVAAERGRSNFDGRHRVSVSYSWDLPFRQTGFLSGWQTFGIWSAQSGRPFTVALLPDLDNSNTGRSILGFGNNDRPNRIASGELSDPTPERWFDTAAFVLPPRGTFGNSGRNILTGPSFHSFDMNVVKNHRFAESVVLQLRFEAFNLFNRTNFNLPGIFLGSPVFGRIESAGSPRRLQVGLKLLF